jgi:hypothetical protein
LHQGGYSVVDEALLQVGQREVERRGHQAIDMQAMIGSAQMRDVPVAADIEIWPLGPVSGAQPVGRRFAVKRRL